MKITLLSISQNVEKIIEIAGRTAYLSFSKQKTGSEKKFIKMIIKRGHTTVLEHASATFEIKGISRACTHQLVRHRLCSFVQQSQRYVDESGFNYVEPPKIKKNIKAHALFVKFMKDAKNAYANIKGLGITNEDARFVLPNAVASEIVVTANLREWRHIVELRGSSSAQWEIRKIAIEILKILKKHAPTVFCDFEIDKKRDVIKRINIS